MIRHSFRIVWGESPELCGNCVFPQNFYTRKLGEITVFYAVRVFFKKSDLVNIRVVPEIFRLTFLLFCEFDCGSDGENVNGPVSERKMI